MVLAFWKNAAVLAHLSLALQLASAALPDGRFHGNIIRPPGVPRIEAEKSGPVTSRNGTELPPYTTIYYFDQLIDHNKPSLGTFKQRYWHTYEFYEPGMSPLSCFRKNYSRQHSRRPHHFDDAWGRQRRWLRRLSHKPNHQWTYRPTAEWFYYRHRAPVLRPQQPIPRLDR